MSGPTTFAEVLRAAVDARGLTLARIVDHLKARGVSTTIATLSYWQTGARRPGRKSSVQVLTALEDVLRLPAGTLVSASEADDAAAAAATTGDPMALWPEPDSLELMLRNNRLNIDDDGLERLSLHDRVRVTPPGQGDVINVRRVFRAQRDGVQMWVAAHQQDLIGTQGVPEIRAVHGCFVNRTFGIASQGLAIVELAVDRPLAKGESVLVEYNQVDVPQMNSRRFYERRFLQPHSEYFLEVSFETDSVPERAETYAWQDDGSEISSPLVVSGGVIQFGLVEPGIGNVGARWDW